MSRKFLTIWMELKAHSPFTLFGAFTGIVCMFAFKGLPQQASERIFYIFHPAHVLLSAIVITSMFELHTGAKKFLETVLIGFLGAVGLATVSDSLIPYAGEILLGMPINPHGHEHAGFVESAHIGFIEGWYIVIPAAIVGIVIALIRPKTKFPHAGHILVSTWASAFHMLMAMSGQLTIWNAIGSFGFLFLAVWLPCCFSDIVFPLLFVRSPIHIRHIHDSHLKVPDYEIPIRFTGPRDAGGNKPLPHPMQGSNDQSSCQGR